VRNTALEQEAAVPLQSDIETVSEDQDHLHANIVKEVMFYQRFDSMEMSPK
jgi:hypothetical protein